MSREEELLHLQTCLLMEIIEAHLWEIKKFFDQLLENEISIEYLQEFAEYLGTIRSTSVKFEKGLSHLHYLLHQHQLDYEKFNP